MLLHLLVLCAGISVPVHFRKQPSRRPEDLRTVASMAVPDRFSKLKEKYDRDGFVILENLLDKDGVDKVLAEMLAVVDGSYGEIEGVTPRSAGQTDDDVQSGIAAIHFPHKLSEHLKGVAAEHDGIKDA